MMSGGILLPGRGAGRRAAKLWVARCDLQGCEGEVLRLPRYEWLSRTSGGVNHVYATPFLLPFSPGPLGSQIV